MLAVIALEEDTNATFVKARIHEELGKSFCNSFVSVVGTAVKEKNDDRFSFAPKKNVQYYVVGDSVGVNITTHCRVGVENSRTTVGEVS